MKKAQAGGAQRQTADQSSAEVKELQRKNALLGHETKELHDQLGEAKKPRSASENAAELQLGQDGKDPHSQLECEEDGGVANG